jgi:hypothetical protein
MITEIPMPRPLSLHSLFSAPLLFAPSLVPFFVRSILRLQEKKEIQSNVPSP